MEHINLINKEFGLLKVISYAGTDQHRHAYWMCECSCGRTKKISSNHLLRKIEPVVSCGNNIHRIKLDGDSRPFNNLYSQYKYNADKRGYTFELSKDEFREITSSDCHYCGQHPSMVSKSKGCKINYIYNGIDRANNDDGYTKHNSLPCCKRCNLAKNEMSYDEFLMWIRNLYERFHKTSI